MRLSGQNLAHAFANIQFDQSSGSASLDQASSTSTARSAQGSSFSASGDTASMQRLLGTQAQQNDQRPGLADITSTGQIDAVLRNGGVNGLERLIEESLIDLKPSMYQTKDHLSPYFKDVDTGPVSQLMQLAKRMSTTQRGQVFQAVANSLDKLNDADGAARGQAKSVLRREMTSLLKSDTRGIMGHLEHQDPQARSLNQYLGMMYEQHDQPAVRNMLKSVTQDLVYGPNMQASDVFIGARSSSGQYKNAENLGYYAGSTKVALDRIVRNKQDQAQAINDIFLGALKTGIGFTHLAPAADLIGVFEQRIADGVISRLGRGEISARDALYEITYPRDGHGNKLDNDSGALGVWKNVYNHVAVNR